MQELSFELSHLKIAALAFGDPAKPMVLALHGWLDNAMSFSPLADYLDDYYIVALDLAGHGNSSHRSAGCHYHLMDFVYDLHELVETQQWQSFILMGHSMGGIIGSLYAASFSEKVTQLISIESFGPISKEPQSSAQQLRESIESRLQASRSEARHPGSLQRTIQARAKAGDMSLDSARLLVERNVAEQGQQLMYKTDRRLRTLSSLRFTDEQVEAFLRGIECPMLVLQGEQGFESMRRDFIQRRHWVKNLSAQLCPGGHHLHMDNPQVVAQYIASFLHLAA